MRLTLRQMKQLGEISGSLTMPHDDDNADRPLCRWLVTQDHDGVIRLQDAESDWYLYPEDEGSKPLTAYDVTTEFGTRTWMAEDYDHACEQHKDAFPDEVILSVSSFERRN